MGVGAFGQCRGCGRRVVWIKTKAGKNMPCDPTIVDYKEDPAGKEKIVTQKGDVVTGITGVNPGEADGMGYISHFATCPQAKNYRRSRAGSR